MVFAAAEPDCEFVERAKPGAVLRVSRILALVPSYCIDELARQGRDSRHPASSAPSVRL